MPYSDSNPSWTPGFAISAARRQDVIKNRKQGGLEPEFGIFSQNGVDRSRGD